VDFINDDQVGFGHGEDLADGVGQYRSRFFLARKGKPRKFATSPASFI
jgi:hypothetical protein